MKIADLLASHELKLTLLTNSTPEVLDRTISGSAVSEMIDPTPYLQPDEVLLTCGIGLNFRESRTWDAYVERLHDAQISAVAFATGIAHHSMPEGLVNACNAYEIALVEISAPVAPLLVDRFVAHKLQLEQVNRMNRGWALADDLSRLAHQDADVTTLLTVIHAEIDAPISVYDGYGSLIAHYPLLPKWPTQLSNTVEHGWGDKITRFSLPMGVDKPCELHIKLPVGRQHVSDMLGPAISIIALQITRSLNDDSKLSPRVKKFVELCSSWSETTRRDVIFAFRETGLDEFRPTGLFVANMNGEYATASGQLRMLIHDAFHEVRITEIEGIFFALCQVPKPEAETVLERIRDVLPDHPMVSRRDVTTIDQLRLGVVHARGIVYSLTQPTEAPELGLSAVVAATAGRGAREAADEFLQPLFGASDEEGMLLNTLREYLRSDAQPVRACEALFVHRNTLRYRIQKLETLLKVDLSTLEGLTTCMLALELSELRNY